MIKDFFVQRGKAGSDNERRIVIANRLALLLICIVVPYSFLFLHLKLFTQALVIYPLLSVLVVSIFLNSRGNERIGKHLILSSINLNLIFYACSFGKEGGVHLFLFALATAPIVIFSFKEKISILFQLIFPIFSFILLEVTNFTLFQTVPISPTYEKILYLTVIVATFISIIFTIFFYFLANKKSTQLYQEKVAELEKTNQELQQSKNDNEILAQQTAHSRLVRGIAHEIKNPIGAMFTRADFVREDPETTPAVMKFCNIVMEACDRLSRLTEAMLRYGGNSTVNQTTFDAKEMVENVMIISTGFKEKNIALSADLDEGLKIYGNTDFIHSVVQNLLANALQYTDEGSVSVSAKAATYVDSNGVEREGVCIRVVDTGAGIPEDQIDKIFDPYFTSKNSSTNMGLGLSFVYKTVVESGGRVEVRSVVGEGSDFGVYLPVG